MALGNLVLSACPNLLRWTSQPNPWVRATTSLSPEKLTGVLSVHSVVLASIVTRCSWRCSGWLGDEGIVMMASSLGDFVSRISLSAGVSGYYMYESGGRNLCQSATVCIRCVDTAHCRATFRR